MYMASGLEIPTLTELSVTIIRTVVIIFYTFLLLRIIGKKQVSHFTWFDILLVVALGSAVGDTMVYPERTISIIIAMTAIFVVVFLIRILTSLMMHSNQIEEIVEGDPVLLVDNGKVLPDAIKDADITLREFRTLMREKGYTTLRMVDKVFLETNGELSIFHKSKAKKVESQV